MNIGIFDSSLGGLAILREILHELPEYNYVYLGDNARVPYGGRSPEIVYEYTKQAVDFLVKKNCKLIILACNTATAAALKRLQKEYIPQQHPGCKVLGVILPAVETISEKKIQRVGVVGTYATVESESFVREIHKLLPSAKVYQKACPLLVPIIEEGALTWKGLDLILREYLAPLQQKKIEALVLGCTHYELIKKSFARILGKKVAIVAEGKVVAEKLRKYLSKHSELEKALTQQGCRTYYATDLNERYRKLMKFFLGKSLRPRDEMQIVHL